MSQQVIELLSAALAALLARDEANTCRHEDTYRGGALWEICRQCGAKWADDEGGRPAWQDPPEWEAARAVLAAAADTAQPKPQWYVSELAEGRALMRAGPWLDTKGLVPVYPQAAAAPAAQPVALYEVRVSGRLHEVLPLSAAFELPNGKHDLYAAPAAQPVAEPTPAMLAAGMSSLLRRSAGDLDATTAEVRAVWLAMQAAAPTSQAPVAQPGPLVAWITEGGCECLQRGEGPVRVMPEENHETGFTVPLFAYPRSPQADVALNLRHELQQQCSDWGAYWRASDAHGVDLTQAQAVELLREALGVEVAIKPDRDALRYQWHKARNPGALLAIAWGASREACAEGSDVDRATDVAMGDPSEVTHWALIEEPKT